MDIWRLQKEMNILFVPTLYLQCGLINKQQYMQWRERGLAFEMREGVYQMTNPSLLSSRVFSKVSVSLFSYMTFPHDEAIR